MLQLLLTREPSLLEVLDDAIVEATAMQVVRRSVTKLAQEGCEPVEELPEPRTMYSYAMFAAHLQDQLSFFLANGGNGVSLGGCTRGMKSCTSALKLVFCCETNRLGRGATHRSEKELTLTTPPV